VFSIKKILFSCIFPILFFIGACEEDRTLTKLQYMPDMADGPVAKVGRSFLLPPEGSVAYNAIIYPKTIEEAEKFLLSPFNGVENKASVLKEGAHLFSLFCKHCHGPNAEGNGSIVHKFPRPPNLMEERYKEKADGFFFYRITFGSALMPSLGHAIDAEERWKIIAHLRDLQEKAHES